MVASRAVTLTASDALRAKLATEPQTSADRTREYNLDFMFS